MIQKVPGVRNLEFDTTGVGYFQSRKGFKPDVDLFAAALKKKRIRGVKVRSVAKVELPKAVGRLELSVAGVQ